MNKIYPVITLHQPWASWIMRRWKLIETRTHPRFASLKNKEVLIHAGQQTDESAINNSYLTKEQILYNPDEIINGHILGSVFVHDFGKLNKTHSQLSLIECESIDRWGLFLDNINTFEIPIPEKGELGIWYYDLEAKQKVKKPENELKLF